MADTKLDILAAGLALRLIQCGQLVNDAVTGGLSVDAAGLNVKPIFIRFSLRICLIVSACPARTG